VMLAASVPAQEGDELLELGSGAGVASLCVATRVAGCRVSGLEVFPGLVALALDNARINGMEARVTFACADIFDLPKPWRRSFDHVFCNPPFHGEDGMTSPRAERAHALQDRGQLVVWLTSGMKRVRAGGTFTTIFPLWPHPGDPAKRIVVQARKNARAPLALLAGLVLHKEDGTYTPDADTVLRGAGSLALANPRR
jgi:tRNA1Val (adenine37-N6)-methyltransferase